MPLGIMCGLTIVAEIALQQRHLRQLAECGVSQCYTLECKRRGRHARPDIEGRGSHVRIEAVAEEEVADKVVRTIQTEGYPVDLFISEVMVKSTAAPDGNAGGTVSRAVAWARDLIST